MAFPRRNTQFADARSGVEEKRRGVRLNSRVPVKIEWEEGEGAGREESTHTRVVSPSGCLVVIPADVKVEQTIRVTNLANQCSNQAVVVWRGHRQNDGWEIGIRLIEPAIDFWGLEL